MGSRPDPDLARRGEAAPSPASLGFGLAAPLQPGAPSAAQAESGPGPARVGSRPDPYFGEAGPSRPCLRGFALAWQRLRRLAAPSSAGGGRRWAGRYASGFPARPGLRPAGRDCALPCVARPLPGDPPGAPSSAQAESGPDPTRVGFRPDPGFNSWGGVTASPAFGAAWADAESDTAPESVSEDPRHPVEPPARPRPRARAPAPLNSRPSVRLLYAASVSGPRLTPPPHPPPFTGAGAGLFLRYAAPAAPAYGRAGRL